MADEHKTDILMLFKLKDGTGVDAECALGKMNGDDFMDEFEPQSYQDYSNYFQVKTFNYHFELEEADASTGSGEQTSVPTHKAGPAAAPPPPPTKPAPSNVKGAFASWRAATDAEAEKMLFKLDFPPFEFERVIDAASPIFFDHCTKSKSFRSAILVKRKSFSRDADTNAPQAYLRIDFTYPLIVGVNWDDGDLTTEKVQFICQKFKVQYKQQRPDGTMLAAVEAEWKAQDAVRGPT